MIHLDEHIASLVSTYGTWTYGILFLIIFCETGLVVTPFLPGDSLLFAVGAIASTGALDVRLVFVLLSIAAVLGDAVNYWIGRTVGPRVFHADTGRWLNKRHLERTHRFYEKHGGKTIVLARFLPFIRTFAPFVAGVGAMSYPRFLFFNVSGGIFWVALFVFAGYYFGNIPVVKNNFTLVIMAIIVISVIPPFVEYVRHRNASRREPVAAGER